MMSAARPTVHLTIRQTGFTLMEMIISLVVLGLLSVVMLPLLSMPATAYLDAQRRLDLQSQLDLVRSKIGEDLRQALPGSLRSQCIGTTCYLEYLEVRAVGKYRAGGAGGTAYCPAACKGNALDATSACTNENCMTTLGPLSLSVPGVNPVANADYVAVLGHRVDPYAMGAERVMSRLTVWVSRPNDVGLRFNNNNFPDPRPEASNRVYIVSQPVTYECNLTSGLLTKYWGYPVLALQPTAFGAGISRARVADTISRCQMNVRSVGVPAATPIGFRQTATIRLALSRASAGQPTESVESLLQFSVREP